MSCGPRSALRRPIAEIEAEDIIGIKARAGRRQPAIGLEADDGAMMASIRPAARSLWNAAAVA